MLDGHIVFAFLTFGPFVLQSAESHVEKYHAHDGYEGHPLLGRKCSLQCIEDLSPGVLSSCVIFAQKVVVFFLLRLD